MLGRIGRSATIPLHTQDPVPIKEAYRNALHQPPRLTDRAQFCRRVSSSHRCRSSAKGGMNLTGRSCGLALSWLAVPEALILRWLVASSERRILFRNTEADVRQYNRMTFYANTKFHQKRHQECYARSFEIQGKVPNERYHSAHTQRYAASHLVAENSSRSGFDCGRINLKRFASV